MLLVMVFTKKAIEGKLGYHLSKHPDPTTADPQKLTIPGPEDNMHMCTHVGVGVWHAVQCHGVFSIVCPNKGLGQHSGLVFGEALSTFSPELIKTKKRKENIKPNEKTRLKPLGNH